MKLIDIELVVIVKISYHKVLASKNYWRKKHDDVSKTQRKISP